jgi:hypothetical protein
MIYTGQASHTLPRPVKRYDTPRIALKIKKSSTDDQ